MNTNKTARRNDIHSPTNFDPALYEYIGSFDNCPEPGVFVSATRDTYTTCFGIAEDALNFPHAVFSAAHSLMDAQGAKIHFNPADGSSQCDHCGAYIRYVAIFKHTSGEYIATGETCAEERFGCDSRRAYDIKTLRQAAANERERAKIFAVALTYLEEHEATDLIEWMLTEASKTVGGIFDDIAGKLRKWGSISEKQIAFARVLLQQHFEKQRNGGKTEREMQWDAEREAAQDCPEGRIEVIGEVLSAKWHENDFGGNLKLTIKDDRGFRIWVTCPSSIEAKKGDRIQLTATLQPSSDDIKFGFGKRPSKAKVLDIANANKSICATCGIECTPNKNWTKWTHNNSDESHVATFSESEVA